MSITAPSTEAGDGSNELRVEHLGPSLHQSATVVVPQVHASPGGYSLGLPRYWIQPWIVSPNLSPPPAPRASRTKSYELRSGSTNAIAPKACHISKREKQRREEERWAKAAVDRANALFIENAMQAFSVPMHAIAVLGSLTDASALQCIAQASERSIAQSGNAWARRTHHDWLEASGLREAEWILSRQRLRAMGLISERTTFGAARQEIVTEITFNAREWDQFLHTSRDELIESLLTTRRDELTQYLPPSVD